MSLLGGTKIFIDSKRLVVYQTNDSDDGKKIKTKIFESKLEKNNLPQVLREFKEKNQVDRVNLLFADDLAITGIVRDESNSANDRESVGRLVKAKLSIDTEKAVWDYTKVNDYYQIVCLPGDYVSYIAPAFDQAGIKIDSIEPLSVSLAKLLSAQSEPVILVYDDVERLVTICWQGLVWQPTLFIPVELSNKAKKIKINFKNEFSIEVARAVVSANFADPYLADLTALSLAAEINTLDPFTGVEVVTPEVNNVTVVNAAATEVPEDFKAIWQENSKENEKLIPTDVKVTDANWPKPKRNLTWLAIVIPLLITFITVSYLLVNTNNTGEMLNPLIESSVDGVPTASPSAVVADKLTIQVLNGSGKPGEAAKVKGLLEKTGFTVEAVGNATTSSMVKTEIKSTSVLSDAIKKNFQSSLDKLYDTQFTVGAINGFDVIVTVGKSK